MFGESQVIRQTKTIHLKLARVTHLVLNCPSFDLRNYPSSVNFQMLVSTPLPALLTSVSIDQRISCQNPDHRFLNMLYKAYHILLLAQFAVINAVLNKQESAPRLLITMAHKTILRANMRALQSLLLA